jgi:hypothetical protein
MFSLAPSEKVGISDLSIAKALIKGNQLQFMLCDLDDCLKTVDNCADFMKAMCGVVKNSGAQVTLGLFIDGLARKSKDCCRAGEFWRNCVQKMVDVMNEWKMIGIPADPAWD